MYSGFVELPWWGYVVVTLVLTHITIQSVTVFLHRHQAHRALELHGIASHFFRFWLWFTTAIRTKEWVAVHRKHHAKCETEEDPHSPQIHGLKTVFWGGVELYKEEAKNLETLEKYGKNTPDDWIEKNLYVRFNLHGIGLMFLIDVLLFGPIGITMWAVQMAWIPVTAAGIVNGVGHYFGYRNFPVKDASTNILPWGILIGGEELHNNHHAHAKSAKLSSKWYEIDVGWMFICALRIVGLARVKHVAPRVKFDSAKTDFDAETLEIILGAQPDLLARFDRIVKKVNAKAHEIKVLRDNLMALWHDKAYTKEEQLLEHLRVWCKEAKESNIPRLKLFAESLPRCRVKPFMITR